MDIVSLVTNKINEMNKKAKEKAEENARKQQEEKEQYAGQLLRKDFSHALNLLPSFLQPSGSISADAIRTSFQNINQTWNIEILVPDTAPFTPSHCRKLQNSLNNAFRNILSSTIYDFKERILYDVDRYYIFLRTSPTQIALNIFQQKLYLEYCAFFSGNSYKLLNVDLLGINATAPDTLNITASVEFDNYFYFFSDRYWTFF